MAAVDGNAILATLELAATRCADPAPRVYDRLFSAHPDMEALFVRDTNGAVRGEMLARVFEMIIDYVERRAYAAQMIQCEVVTHEGYGVPPEVFRVFFGVVRDTVRDLASADWTPAAEGAWAVMLDEMHVLATRPEPIAAG